MNRKRTGFVTLLVAALIVIMSLSACGAPSNNSTQTSGASTATATSTSTQASLSEVTLKFYFPGDKKPMTDEVWNAVADQTKEKLNAMFNINFVPFGDYPDKMQLLAASGDNYDMNFDADWFIYPTMTNKGAYLDLTELMPEYAPNLFKTYSDLGMLKPCSVDGKLYGIPWTTQSTSRPVFIYRSDLAQKYGITNTDFKTIEDMEQYLYAVKKNDPTVKPLYWTTTDPGGALWPLYAKYEYDRWDFHNLTISLNDSSCKVVPIEQTEMFREACKLAKKWADDGIIDKNMLANADNATWMQDGKQASQVHTFDTAMAATAFTVPGATKSYSVLYPDKKFRFNPPMNNAMAINKNAANPERTLMFLDLLSTDQTVYDTVIYGIKDKTYVLNNNTVNYPDGMDSTKSNYMDWSGQWGFWRSNFIRPDSTRDEKFWATNNDFLKMQTNVMSPIAGLIPNTDSIKTEMAKRDALYDQIGKLLVFGEVTDVDKTLDDYIAKQKAAGLDKILAEVQKQVDAWVAAK